MHPRHSAVEDLGASDLAPQRRHPCRAVSTRVCSLSGSWLSGSLPSSLKPSTIVCGADNSRRIFTLDDSTRSNYCERTVFFGRQARRTEVSWTVDPMHTQVEFSAKHMGLMTVKGHFTGVRVSIDLNEDDFTASAVEATIDTRSLVTNDARRDAHLKSP